MLELDSISVSSLAWSPHQDDIIMELLKTNGLKRIDFAISKYDHDHLLHSNRMFRFNGFSVSGIQTIIPSQKNDVSIVGDSSQMLEMLVLACWKANNVGSSTATLGSPKTRTFNGMNPLEAIYRVDEFFHEAANIAKKFNVVLCLEPNPFTYGAEFLTSLGEVTSLVSSINHPNLRVQLDTGAVLMNSEYASFKNLVENDQHLIGHVHVSEPHLNPIGTGDDPKTLGMMINILSSNYIPFTIEVLDPKLPDENFDHITKSIKFCQENMFD